MFQDTIFAVSTGRARSAIAIIRLSGGAARFALETLAGPSPKERFAALRKLRGDNGAILDEALVLFFAGPRSETGEDVVELHVHGGRAVVASVLGALGRIPGCRPAEAGEFAQRALRNGKMDLLDVESLADLIDADTEAQRRQAIEGGGSLLRGKADHWRETLLDIRADLEAQIDFSDEGDVQDTIDSISERLIQQMIAEIGEALRDADRGERIREGFRVVLLGPPNAGKSSLMNALAGRDVAIVSDIPGTTRDRIEVALDLKGIPVIVTDTAGLQSSDDLVEREGIRRSLLAAEDADLILWLSASDSPTQPPGDLPAGKVRLVVTKTDLGFPQPQEGSWIGVSTRPDVHIEGLLALIESEADCSLCWREPALVTRARHRHALVAAHNALARAAQWTSQHVELRAEEVQNAVRALDRLVGRIDVEDVLGAIFARFCIGK